MQKTPSNNNSDIYTNNTEGLIRFCKDKDLGSLTESISKLNIDFAIILNNMNNFENFLAEKKITAFGEKAKWKRLFQLVKEMPNPPTQDIAVIPGTNGTDPLKPCDSKSVDALFNQNPNANPDAAKNILQHFCPQLGLAFPEYAQRIVNQNASDPLWSSTVTLKNQTGQLIATITAQGNSKRNADNNAALLGIAVLKARQQQEAIKVSPQLPDEYNPPLEIKGPLNPNLIPEEMIKSNNLMEVDAGLNILLAVIDITPTKVLVKNLGDLLNPSYEPFLRRKTLTVLTQLEKKAVSIFPEIIATCSNCLLDNDPEIKKAALHFYLKLGLAPTALGEDFKNKITNILNDESSKADLKELAKKLLEKLAPNHNFYQAPKNPTAILLINLESVPDAVNCSYPNNVLVIGCLSKSHEYAQNDGAELKNKGVMEINIADPGAAASWLTYKAGKLATSYKHIPFHVLSGDLAGENVVSNLKNDGIKAVCHPTIAAALNAVSKLQPQTSLASSNHLSLMPSPPTRIPGKGPEESTSKRPTNPSSGK
jgi:hypothetical protein